MRRPALAGFVAQVSCHSTPSAMLTIPEAEAPERNADLSTFGTPLDPEMGRVSNGRTKATMGGEGTRRGNGGGSGGREGRQCR